MIDRVQLWLASITGRKGPRRHVSRREREEAQRRLLIVGILAAAVVLVVVLAAGAIYQYIYLPRETLASVNNHKISRSDYWKIRKLDLLNQVSQYSQIAQFSTGNQATQYQNLAQQAQNELKTVESDPVDANTLNQMVDDQVVLDGLSDLGLSISDSEMDEYQAQQFAPAPIGSPTPTPPVDPTAAAWATATAEATASASASPAATASATASPAAEAAGTPSAASGTPSTSPTANASDTPSASATSSASGTPSASPTAAGSPTAASPTPTMVPDDARATATANFDQYKKVVLDEAGMSVADFRRLVIRPSLARQKVTQKLQSEVPTRAPQIQASQIMVATEDAANKIVNETLKTKDFADVAKEQSADTTTAPNGGQLGWLPKGLMTPEFDKVAFALQEGEVSKPFHDKYGWEIVKVTAIDPDRPITVETLNQLRTQKVNTWLADQRASSNIDWQIGSPIPSPTAQTEFVPPPDAPPTPTPVPTPTPAATEPSAAATPTP